MKKSNGFTLIEMMIVVAIIAILAVVAMSTISGASKIDEAVETLGKEDASVANFLQSSEGWTSGKVKALRERKDCVVPIAECGNGCCLKGKDLEFDMHTKYVEWRDKQKIGGSIDTL